MDKVLYTVARALVALLQALPLSWVARFGRVGGGVAFYLDARHRRVALANLHMCFGREKSASQLRAIAKENFRRIGESYSCAIKTASMSPEALSPHCRFTGTERILPTKPGARPQTRIVAIGHFGNFELYARFGQFFPGYQCATTYRGLQQPLLTLLMQSMRERSGCRFFERRTEGAALRAALAEPGLLLGLLADQHAGRRGLWLPFFGHECSTSPAPAVLALRYECPLHVGICYRVGSGRWEIAIGDEIPTRHNGAPRSAEAVMRDVNRVLEQAVRRDPANWFWVHRRWKPFQPRAGGRAATPRPEPAEDIE